MDDSNFSEMNKCFNKRTVDRIIEVRNNISHGAEPSDLGAKEQLNKYVPELNILVKKLLQNQNKRRLISHDKGKKSDF